MVDKFTKSPKGEEIVSKINEVIDNLDSGSIDVDGALSTTSKNPVQNKVITEALNGKQDALEYTPANQTNKVNGAPLSNTNSYFFGISDSAATAVEKTVSIPSITELSAGQFIIVKPTITSVVANATLKLNNFSAYPIKYQNATITTTTDAYTWTANTPSVFIFDGDYWIFVAQGYRQTYLSMSSTEGITGTATSARSLTATNLKAIIQGTTLTGIDVSTTGAVTASDNILSGLGKLQATKQPTLVSGTNIKTINGNSLLGSGNITIEAGSDVDVDTALSTTSTNPVQNKVITTELNKKINTSDIASSVSASSTNAVPVGAKLFYDTVGNIETLLQGV